MKVGKFSIFSVILIGMAFEGFGYTRTFRPTTVREREHSVMGSGLGLGRQTNQKRLTPLNTRRRRKQKDYFPEVTEQRELEDAEPEKEVEVIKRTVFMGPKTGWGFLKVNAPYYSMNGKNQGKLQAGTLFTYDGVKQSKTTSLLVSRIRLKGEKWQTPFLLDCSKVAAYDGDPKKISPKILKDLWQYFMICGKIDEREEYLKGKAFNENPHYVAATEAYKKYQETLQKAAEMEDEMQTMSGLRRYQAQKKLADYKYVQAKLKVESETKMRAYKKWKAEHPIDPNAVSSDEFLIQLKQQQEELRKRHPQLIPQQ